LSLQPDSDRARSNLAKALNHVGARQMSSGEFQQASHVFRRAISLQPDLAEASSNLGSAFHELGQFEAAIASFRRAIELRADLADVHFNLGVTYLLTGDFERGWTEYAWRARSPL